MLLSILLTELAIMGYCTIFQPPIYLNIALDPVPLPIQSKPSQVAPAWQDIGTLPFQMQPVPFHRCSIGVGMVQKSESLPTASTTQPHIHLFYLPIPYPHQHMALGIIRRLLLMFGF